MRKLHMSLKKNQIIVFVIGLMVITAGYLSYSNNLDYMNSIEAGALADSEEMASIGDAKLVSANIADENTIDQNVIDGNEVQNDNANQIDSEETTNNTVNEYEISNIVEDVSTTLAEEDNDDYFVSSRLERNTMYSQAIETYQKILNNTNISETQKKSAQQEITRLNNEQNGIMITENIIKTKGIEDLVIFSNNGSINVIIKGEEPEKNEIAQIQNIITRELEADIEDIHIMNKEDEN